MTRRRWLYTMGGRPLETPVEVGEDYVPPDSERVPVTTDLYMDGVRATDGTDISSRGKRREWMKRHNLVDVDDCKGMWAEAEKRREAMAQGKHDVAERREAIQRAMYQLGQRGR